MKVVLSQDGDGGVAAQTGNLVHSAAHAFHTGDPATRLAAAKAALDLARAKFPVGDAEKAHAILAKYAADPENQEAETPWSEERVILTLPAAGDDPTGSPVVIVGHLDQVRRHKDGRLRVWDIKTGERLDGSDTLTEYMIQQAVYTLAARESLDPTIEPGGIIYTPGYTKTRGRVHLSLPLTVESCRVLVSVVPDLVAAVRAGRPLFCPSVDACRWCPVKPWPACLSRFNAFYGA